MKKILFFILIVSIFSCKKEGKLDLSIPTCIKNKVVDNANTKVLTVKIQKINGALHYWLNTDVRFVDGQEYIVSANCDTLCAIGGFRPKLPNDCANNYDPEKWTIIWKK